MSTAQTHQTTKLEPVPRPCPAYPMPPYFKPIEDSCPKTKKLPQDYRVDYKLLQSRTYRPPGKLFYGFGINYQDIIDYADKHQLIPSDVTEMVDRYSIASSAGIDHLRKLCNFYDLRLKLPVSVHYQQVIALYDNYTIDDLELDPEEEADVIRILQEQFPVCCTQNPTWFFDRMDGRNGA